VVPIARWIAAWWAGRDSQAGQGLAEYAVILALIAVVAIVAVTMLGGNIAAMLDDIGTSVEAARS
jgi:Flp pilus assembly pilin Flp